MPNASMGYFAPAVIRWVAESLGRCNLSVSRQALAHVPNVGEFAANDRPDKQVKFMRDSRLGARPSGVLIQKHVGFFLIKIDMKKVITRYAEFMPRPRRLVSMQMANSRLHPFWKMA